MHEELREYDTRFVFRSKYYNIAEVFANTKTGEVWFTNFLDDAIILPFNRKTNATMCDLIEFFEDRCFERGRFDLRDILDRLGLVEYNPFHIVYRYGGKAAEDHFWIDFLRWEGDYDRAYKFGYAK